MAAELDTSTWSHAQHLHAHGMFVLMSPVENDNIKPVIDKVFRFDKVLDAMNYMESGAKVGKIVIKI
jgi:NADPH:quinone reductase-like Zn-dependent oxidoreductase